MIPKRTKSTLLAGLLLTGLTSGCFGNCGGCVGNKLGESFEAIGEAVEKDLQADVKDGLEAEADRELAVAEGRAPAQGEAKSLASYLPQFPLSGLNAAGLKARFGSKGFEFAGCNEFENVDGLSSVACKFKKKDLLVLANLLRFDQAEVVAGIAVDWAHEGQIVIRDGSLLLTVRAVDSKQAEGILTKLVRADVSSARAARLAIEKQGFHAGGCEREEEEDDVTTSCALTKASMKGSVVWVRSGEAELDAGAGSTEWDDELDLSIYRGSTVAMLSLRDRAAAKQAAKLVFPELDKAVERLVVTVFMDEEKPSGKGWDALGGDPDPFIEVDGKSYRDERCENAYECTFVVPRADAMEIEVIDADGARDDSAGKTVCRPGQACETRGATIQVTEIW